MSTQPTPISVNLTEIPSIIPIKVSIPEHIFVLLIAQLPNPSLAVAARVSKFFYTLTTRFLYQSIIFDSTFLRQNKNQTRAFQYYRQPSVDRFTSGLGQSLSSESHVPSAAQTSLVPPLPNRFHDTKTLTLVSHRHEQCLGLAHVDIPNIVTLRIINSIRGEYGAPDSAYTLDLCICSSRGHYLAEVMRCKCPHLCCPLVADLKPSRLILGSWSTGLEGSGKGLWSDHSSPPPSIQEVVIFLGEESSCVSGHYTGKYDPTDMPLVIGLPKSMYRLTLIFWSWAGALQQKLRPEEWWSELKVRPEVADLDDYHEIEPAHSVIAAEAISERLAATCFGKSEIVEVIGLEALVRDESARENMVETLRRKIKEYHTKAGMSEEEASRWAERVTILTGDEYLKRKGDKNAIDSREAVITAIKDERCKSWDWNRWDEAEEYYGVEQNKY